MQKPRACSVDVFVAVAAAVVVVEGTFGGGSGQRRRTRAAFEASRKDAEAKGRRGEAVQNLNKKEK